jgi:hypothetical protein
MSNLDQDQIEIPIETEEQAQLLELMFREKAIAKVNSALIVLEGITEPDDVPAEGLECAQCGDDVPAARVKALMTQVPVGDKLVWKANPNAVICVHCATKNEKLGKQYWHGAKEEPATF